MTRIEDTLIGDNSLKTVKEKKRSDTLKSGWRYPKVDKNSLLLAYIKIIFRKGKYSGTQVFYSKTILRSSVVAQLIQSDIARLLQRTTTGR